LAAQRPPSTSYKRNRKTPLFKHAKVYALLSGSVYIKNGDAQFVAPADVQAPALNEDKNPKTSLLNKKHYNEKRASSEKPALNALK
jgi:hypothetical protein